MAYGRCGSGCKNVREANVLPSEVAIYGDHSPSPASLPNGGNGDSCQAATLFVTGAGGFAGDAAAAGSVGGGAGTFGVSAEFSGGAARLPARLSIRSNRPRGNFRQRRQDRAVPGNSSLTRKRLNRRGVGVAGWTGGAGNPPSNKAAAGLVFSSSGGERAGRRRRARRARRAT